MKQIVASLMFGLLLCPLANGKDTLWGLGDNNRIAVSFFEHRSDAPSRVIDVTLIAGDWFLAGTVKEPSDGRIEDRPISLTAKGASFEGTISVEFGGETSGVKLKGKLTLGANVISLDESILCKKMVGL